MLLQARYYILVYTLDFGVHLNQSPMYMKLCCYNSVRLFVNAKST